MDALPIQEEAGSERPWQSKVPGKMHACGHDGHTAALVGAVHVLAERRAELKGSVKFIFQPSEEGVYNEKGEKIISGAELMVREGVLENPKVDAIFGLHINSGTEVGTIKFKPGGEMAAADRFVIKVKGKQTHGSTPWTGIDPITVASQIVIGLQMIIARQTDLTKEPAVISVGKFSAGVRNNIIPEEAELVGTIRTLDVGMQKIIYDKIRLTATNIAEAAGAVAEVDIQVGVPITYNDPALTQAMGPTMKRVVGIDNVVLTQAITGSEDFSFFANKVPGLFLFVGGMPKGQDPKTAAPHHTPDFVVDDSGMKTGVRLLCNLTVDYGKNK
jgi:amidohydrolase